MNINQAIKLLKEHGFSVLENGTEKEWLEAQKEKPVRFVPFSYRDRKKITPKNKDKYYRLFIGATFWATYNTREVIGFARRKQKNHSSVSRLVKEGKGKDRAAIRDAIKREEFDIIPQNSPIKKDDRWNYD